jgi:hypothetical protein
MASNRIAVTVSQLRSAGVYERSLHTTLRREGFKGLAEQIEAGVFTPVDEHRNLPTNAGAYFHQKNRDTNAMLVTNVFVKELIVAGVSAQFITLPELWEAVCDEGYRWSDHVVVFGMQDTKTNPYAEDPKLLRKLEYTVMKRMEAYKTFSFVSEQFPDVRSNDWYTDRFLNQLRLNTIVVAL